MDEEQRHGELAAQQASKETTKASTALEGLGPGAERVTEIFSMMGVGAMPNPLHGKMTEGHITQVLELASKHDERDFLLEQAAQKHEADERREARRLAFLGLLVSAALFVLLIVMFKDAPEVLVPILTGLGGVAGGFLGGRGYERVRYRDE